MLNSISDPHDSKTKACFTRKGKRANYTLLGSDWKVIWKYIIWRTNGNSLFPFFFFLNQGIWVGDNLLNVFLMFPLSFTEFNNSYVAHFFFSVLGKNTSRPPWFSSSNFGPMPWNHFGKSQERWKKKPSHLCNSSRKQPPPHMGTDLRTNLDVILLIIPVDVPLLACAKAPGSCEGEAGGPL